MSTPARKTITIHQLNIQHDTIKHITPQPSTPIERAGSDIWEGGVFWKGGRVGRRKRRKKRGGEYSIIYNNIQYNT